jgi:hypothetical protein
MDDCQLVNVAMRLCTGEAHLSAVLIQAHWLARGLSRETVTATSGPRQSGRSSGTSDEC